MAICGRNLRLKRRLDRLAAGYGDRLTVIGFADNMADWLRCADLVVTKAGPGTIAEAACCAAPLLLTSHLPGQEKGNTRVVAGAAAGAARASRLSEIGSCCDDARRRSRRVRALGGRVTRVRIAEPIAGLVPARAIPAGAGR